jgi:hypothetical protein
MSPRIPKEDLPLIIELIESGMRVTEIAEKWEVVPRSICFFVKRHADKSPRQIKEGLREKAMIEALLNKEPLAKTASKMGLSKNRFIEVRQKYRLADIENRDPNSLAMLMANREYNKRSFNKCSI